MPPFAQFRLWLREGPRAERSAAVLATAVVLTLLAFALVPVSNSSSGPAYPGAGPATVVAPTSAASSGHHPPSSGPGQKPPPVGATTVGGSSASTSSPGVRPGTTTTPGQGHHAPKPGKTTTPAADACAGATLTSAQGVTPTEVHIDVAIPQLAGAVGNAAFNIPADQVGLVNAVTNYINHHGGVACGRKLVTKVYKVNPIDSNSQQSTCLQMVQDKPIAVINTGAYVTPVSQQCFINNHLPLETGTSPGATQARDAYPYLFSPQASSEQQVRNGILGAAAHGFFKAPKFTKISLFEDSCLPSANTEISNDLADAGVKSSQIQSYVVTCELIGSPVQILQAVAKAKLAGANTVFLGSSIFNNESFVSDAGQQDYHPQYLTSDYGTGTLGSGSSKWAKNFNGAVAFSSTRSGDLNSGIHSPGEKLCNKILIQNKLPGIKSENADDAASGECDQVRFLAQAINSAGPNPSPSNLVPDLGTMGRFNSAYEGDSVWDHTGQLTGGTFVREIEWYGYCRCWKVKTPYRSDY